MAHRTKCFVTILIAAIVLLAITDPATAAFSWYDWNTGSSQFVGTTLVSSPPLQKGQDIVSAYYAADADYRFFRMDMKAAPDAAGNGYASDYAFFIVTGSAVSYLDALPKPLLSNPALLKFTPDGGTFVGGTTYAFDELYFRTTGPTLEWAVKKGQLPDTFAWFASTLYDGHCVTSFLDVTVPVVTPIPSAALLLGSGILGLIGLKRRNSKRVSLDS